MNSIQTFTPLLSGSLLRQIRLLFPLLTLTLFLAGCPKSPGTGTTVGVDTGAPKAPDVTAVSEAPAAGAPFGAEAPDVAPSALGTAAPRITMGAQAALPSPKEFATIPELRDIHFDFDRYSIPAADAKILDENARWMKANPNSLILIEGHCDERGTNEYNLALGERRAKATLNYLIAQGVRASRFTIISYGEERPLCPEKNEECWARNRRATFLVKAL